MGRSHPSYLLDTLGVDQSWLADHRSNLVPHESSQTPVEAKAFSDASALRNIRSASESARYEDVLARATNLLNQKWTRLDSTSVFLVASMARDAGVTLHRLNDALHFAHLSRYYSRHLPASRQAETLIRIAEIQMHLEAFGEVREALDAARHILHNRSTADAQVAARLHVVRARWRAEALLRGERAVPSVQHMRAIIREGKDALSRVTQAPVSIRTRVDLAVSEAIVEHVAKRRDASRIRLDQARQLASKATSPEVMLRVRRAVAMLHDYAGESERALAEYKKLAAEGSGHAFYRSAALVGIAETAAKLGQVSQATAAVDALQKSGAHREHQRAMRAIATAANSNDGPVQRWMIVAIFVLVVTVGWNVVTRHWSARNAVDQRIYVRGGSEAEEREHLPHASSKWEPIDPKTLIEVVEAEHVPVYRNVRRDREPADREAGREVTGRIELDLSRTSAVTVSLPMSDVPLDVDRPDMRTPNPRSSDPASDGSGVQVACISEAGDSLPPLHLSCHLGEAFTTDRLVALQTNAGAVLFYKLNTPGENAVRCRSGNIDLKSVGRIIGIPLAIIESGADR